MKGAPKGLVVAPTRFYKNNGENGELGFLFKGGRYVEIGSRRMFSGAVLNIQELRASLRVELLNVVLLGLDCPSPKVI